MTSPAERYAAARTRAQSPQVQAFASDYAFGLDEFQRLACASLERGSSVLVAAPTGAGKTVVGEFAVYLALQAGRKCFYTTPIKALSNQKYHDLVERFGADRIGLLTGDSSVNSEASVVVMTTEVLRNMLYAQSSTLNNLAYVVMDEVHYLADRFRGAVWEEVMIHLPEAVSIAALSATVSNAEEFGAWLATVRGETDIIVEEHRPVPLWQHVIAGHRMYDLFVDDEQQTVNPELERLARDSTRRAPRDGRGNRRRHSLTPYRSDVVHKLDDEHLLPAIYFLFSRNGCDDAVQQCLHAGLRLNSKAERAEVRAYALGATRHLPDEDLLALGFDEWIDALERGIAAHHAGLLPAFKEVVEHLFQDGLIKVVFATETLALGINMPARSVVLEKLTKWNGETHVELTPGEYTQLTGRAGRRGIDVEGHGVVLWQEGLDPRAVAGLASTRTYPLRSSFQPSYNMAVNLVARLGRHTAREVLETSFAQFQADRSVVGLATQVRRLEEGLAGYRDAMACHLGDFVEYSALREQISRREKDVTRSAAARRREDASHTLRALKPGDVIIIPAGKRAGPAVVLDTGFGGDSTDPRPLVLTSDRQVRRISTLEVNSSLEVLGRIRIPRTFSARNPQSRRDLASALREVAGDRAPGRSPRTPHTEDELLVSLRAQMRQHPCHGCDEREQHARWAERYHRAQREIRDLEQRVEGRTNSIARHFDRICAVLAEMGYLTSAGDDAQVTSEGDLLMGLYTEADLLTALCLREGTWDDLTAAELAAVCSALVFESRSSDDETPKVPLGPIREAFDSMHAMWLEIRDIESRHRLDATRAMDTGFVWAMYRWCQGSTLSAILSREDLTAGDFVRWSRQVIDLLGQVAQALPAGSEQRATAHAAADLVNRGVVASVAQA
ncbi:MAG: DEAD/DEAH box helicase [Candidatus Nanopelagicales bacterium]|nr:DEAD/DEAH box helicase [Candidatus Nanopelagicales bacterium]